MKIATYKDGSRDGQLVVVSRDLSLAHYATGIAGRVQQLLDDWNFLSPQLEELSQTLNHGKARHAFAFEPGRCLAPLPRAHCIALVDPPAARREQQPLALRIVRGDALLGARDPLPAQIVTTSAAETSAQPDEFDFCGQLAVVTGDLAAGTAAADALASIRLVMLASSWQRPQPDDQLRASAWGSISFAPVAVTPDELGAAFADGRIDLPVEIQRGGKRFGRCATAGDAGWSIGEVLAECARQGDLRSGAIVGLGMPTSDGEHGDFSIALRRQREHELNGAAVTPYLFGDESLRLDVIGRDSSSVFGAIEPALASQA